MHGSLFKNTHVVAKDPLKFNKVMNTYLIN